MYLCAVCVSVCVCGVGGGGGGVGGGVRGGAYLARVKQAAGKPPQQQHGATHTQHK